MPTARRRTSLDRLLNPLPIPWLSWRAALAKRLTHQTNLDSNGGSMNAMLEQVENSRTDGIQTEYTVRRKYPEETESQTSGRLESRRIVFRLTLCIVSKFRRSETHKTYIRIRIATHHNSVYSLPESGAFSGLVRCGTITMHNRTKDVEQKN
jgi:hypothetical protein